MQKTLKRAELEEQIHGKSESIARRLEAIQQEVGGISVKRMLRKNPWIGLAAITAGGLLVGLLFGGRRASRGSRSTTSEALVDGYIASISDDVKRMTARGKDASHAVAEALRTRMPIVIYPTDEERDERGFVRRTASLVFKAAAGFAVKAALDYATERIELERRMREFTPGGDGSAPALEGGAAQNQRAS